MKAHPNSDTNDCHDNKNSPISGSQRLHVPVPFRIVDEIIVTLTLTFFKALAFCAVVFAVLNLIKPHLGSGWGNDGDIVLICAALIVWEMLSSLVVTVMGLDEKISRWKGNEGTTRE